MESELVVGLISSVFIAIGAILWKKGDHLLFIGKKTQAVIFRNNYQSSGSGGGLYYPVIRFKTESDEWITHELSTGHSPARPEGKKLEVIYDPEDPSNVALNNKFQLEILPRLMVSAGIVGLIVSILIYTNLP